MSEQYYIRNKQAGFLGNSPVWWAIKGRGYTAYIQNAERFEQDRAERMVKELPDKYEMYKCREVDRRLQLVFDDQDERRLADVPEEAGNPWGALCRYAPFIVPDATDHRAEKLDEDELEARKDIICLKGIYYRIVSGTDADGFDKILTFGDGFLDYGIILDGMNGQLYAADEELDNIEELPPFVQTVDQAMTFLKFAGRWHKAGRAYGRREKEHELRRSAQELLSSMGLGEAA